MIFTFKGYSTYIFDLNSKGKALTLKNGILDLDDPSSPDRVGIVRLDDDKVVMDVTDESVQSVNDPGRRSFVIENGGKLQIADNELHLHLNYSASGTLMGGEFILVTSGVSSGTQADGDFSETTPPDPNPPSISSSQEAARERTLSKVTKTEAVIGNSTAGGQPERKADVSIGRDGIQDDGELFSGENSTREKLDQIARETSVIESTDFTENDDDDDSDDSDALPKSDSRQSSQSPNSDSGSRGRKRERLDDIARKTSIIENTFLSEKIETKRSAPPSPPPGRAHLLQIGEGFKKDPLTGGYEYTVKSFIGKGGFGEVYQLEDRQGNPYALKVLNPEITKGREHIFTLFDNEVSIGRYLEFPALVRTLESGFDLPHGLRYCVMAFVDGVNFAHVIAYLAKEGKRMHYLYATWIVLKVAEVLEFLSSNGVVHRDIKTQNVMVNRQGDVKVMDLGIARQRNDSSPLKPNEPLGTLSYLPMGQLQRKDPVDVRVDIYCLGVMYYWLLTNRPPIPEPPPGCDSRIRHFREVTVNIYKDPSIAPNPKKVVRRIPSEVARIAMKMMEQDVDKRYANVKDLIGDLSNVVNTDGTSEKVAAELSRLCSNVVHLKPYVPPAYLPACKRHVRYSLWLVLFVSVLLLCISYSFRYIEDFNRNEAKFHGLVDIKQTQEGVKFLNDLERDLNELKTIRPISWSSEQWQQWFRCKQKETNILDFVDKYNDLSQKADNVIWFLKHFYWVQETPKLWSSDERKQFDVIQNHMKNITGEIKTKGEEINENLKNDTENLKRAIRKLNYRDDKQTQDKYKVILDNYLVNIKFITLSGYDHNNLFIKENIEDFVDIYSSFSSSPSGAESFKKTWLNWCYNLWKIKNFRERVFKEMIAFLDKELNRQTTIHWSNKIDTYYFCEFKNDFKFALEKNTILFATAIVARCKANVNLIVNNIDSNSLLAYTGGIMDYYYKALEADEDIRCAVKYIDEHYDCSDDETGKTQINKDEILEIKTLVQKEKEDFNGLKKIYKMSIILEEAEQRYGMALKKSQKIKDLMDKNDRDFAKNEFQELDKYYILTKDSLNQMTDSIFPNQKQDLLDKWDSLIINCKNKFQIKKQ